jgi:hypothetical protein
LRLSAGELGRQVVGFPVQPDEREELERALLDAGPLT